VVHCRFAVHRVETSSLLSWPLANARQPFLPRSFDLLSLGLRV
jgi:hypothetical protein